MSERPTLPLAVLISGRGSNLQNLIAAQDASYRIILVISNIEGAAGLDRAQAAGIATTVIPHAGKTREAFDAEMDAALRAAGAEIVVLANDHPGLADGLESDLAPGAVVFDLTGLVEADARFDLRRLGDGAG